MWISTIVNITILIYHVCINIRLVYILYFYTESNI